MLYYTFLEPRGTNNPFFRIIYPKVVIIPKYEGTVRQFLMQLEKVFVNVLPISHNLCFH